MELPATKPPGWHDSPLLCALRRQDVPYTPVWIMRQAGRYLREYRAIREKVSFLELCRNPDLCAEVAVLAVQRLGVDAAILFSDLLVVLEPMGFAIEFGAGEGPVLRNPIRAAADVDRVAVLENPEAVDYVIEAVRRTRAALSAEIPLLGFAGAPFTLASYALEGGSSHHWRRTKSFMYRDQAAWDELMGRLVRSVASLLNGQIRAGVQAVQVFDSWVGCLGPDDYRRYVLPHSRALIAAIDPRASVIHFSTGNPALLPLVREAGGQVIGVDWRVRLDDAWRSAGDDRGVQGNLDPVVLLSDPNQIRQRVREVLQQAAGRKGHIFNLGHGILPDTPVENAIAMVDAVHEFSARR